MISVIIGLAVFGVSVALIAIACVVAGSQHREEEIKK